MTSTDPDAERLAWVELIAGAREPRQPQEPDPLKETLDWRER